MSLQTWWWRVQGRQARIERLERELREQAMFLRGVLWLAQAHQLRLVEFTAETVADRVTRLERVLSDGLEVQNEGRAPARVRRSV